MKPLSTTTSKLPTTILDYHKRSFFVFVPNLCNAKCDFCYVSPVETSSAQIPESSLRRFEVLATSLSRLGFREVRFTGGEPLIFRNFQSLLQIAKGVDLDYTLLTNGSLLGKNIEKLLSLPPSKVTVSVHSLKDPSSVFGVDWDLDEVLSSILTLTQSGIFVACSALYDPARHADIVELADTLPQIGVFELKLIYPNTDVGSSALTRLSYRNLVSELSDNLYNVRLRATDLDATECLLQSRGHLSVTLPTLEIYSCCVQVGGESSLGSLASGSPTELARLIVADYERRAVINGFMCETFTESCPVALREFGSPGRSVSRDGAS